MAFRARCAPAVCASNLPQRYASAWCRLRSFSVLLSSKRLPICLGFPQAPLKTQGVQYDNHRITQIFDAMFRV